MSKAWDGQERRQGGCSCEALTEAISRIEKKVDKIDQRLFIGNGEPSIMIRIDRAEQIQKVLVWACSVAGGGIILAVVGISLKVFAHGVAP